MRSAILLLAMVANLFGAAMSSSAVRELSTLNNSNSNNKGSMEKTIEQKRASREIKKVNPRGLPDHSSRRILKEEVEDSKENNLARRLSNGQNKLYTGKREIVYILEAYFFDLRASSSKDVVVSSLKIPMFHLYDPDSSVDLDPSSLSIYIHQDASTGTEFFEQGKWVQQVGLTFQTELKYRWEQYGDAISVLTIELDQDIVVPAGTSIGVLVYDSDGEIIADEDYNSWTWKQSSNPYPDMVSDGHLTLSHQFSVPKPFTDSYYGKHDLYQLTIGYSLAPECKRYKCDAGACSLGNADAGTSCGGTPSGVCDAADTCDGAGACVDNVEDEGVVCREAVDGLDTAEVCDGSTKACPADDRDLYSCPAPQNGVTLAPPLVRENANMFPYGAYFFDLSSTGSNTLIVRSFTFQPETEGTLSVWTRATVPSKSKDHVYGGSYDWEKMGETYVVPKGRWFSAKKATTVSGFDDIAIPPGEKRAVMLHYSGSVAGVPSEATESNKKFPVLFEDGDLALSHQYATPHDPFGDTPWPDGQAAHNLVGLLVGYVPVDPANCQTCDFSPCMNENAVCSDEAAGDFACTCDSGFIGNGIDCFIDPCATQNGGCDANAVCVSDPSDGSNSCDCNVGYKGDGETCSRIAAQNLCSIVEDNSGFDICMDPIFDSSLGAFTHGNWEEGLIGAKARWEAIITGDIGSTMNPLKMDYQPRLLEGLPAAIDDLYISVENTDIDGPGGILGRGGYVLQRCGSRDCGKGNQEGYPLTGAIEFDHADIDRLMERGKWEDVIIHEIAHVLGFGTLWEDFGIVLNATQEYTYLGEHACAAWETLTGCGGCPPLEDAGGAGTAGMHWNEFNEVDEQGYDLDAELMTGWQENGDRPYEPISTITIASMHDLGYTVDYGQADTFSFQPSCTSRKLRGERRLTHEASEEATQKAVDYAKSVIAEMKGDGETGSICVDVAYEDSDEQIYTITHCE